jgi:predicted TIM-barrel fold metal-dependent hydrolase
VDLICIEEHTIDQAMTQAAMPALLGEAPYFATQGASDAPWPPTTPAQLAPSDQAVALTRAANDRLAAAVLAHPDRLSGFAVLPWQNPAAACAELDRSVREPGLKGALSVGRPGATFLDHPRYAPVLKKLSELQVPLYVHPYHPLPQVPLISSSSTRSSAPTESSGRSTIRT